MKVLHDFIDLSDVTALITVRIDSPERKSNLTALLRVLLRDFKINIFLWEADIMQKFHPIKSSDKIKYKFIKDSDPIFHRTKYFRLMQNEIRTPFIAIWDVDVIGIPVQIYEAVTSLRDGRAFIALPYDGRVCAIDAITSTLFRKTLNYEALTHFSDQMPLMFGYLSVGGICFLNLEKYIMSGGENEIFYGWGPEDIERIKRFEINGYPIYQSQGKLFHLFHPVKSNSWYYNTENEISCRKEFLRICSLRPISS